MTSRTVSTAPHPLRLLLKNSPCLLPFIGRHQPDPALHLRDLAGVVVRGEGAGRAGGHKVAASIVDSVLDADVAGDYEATWRAKYSWDVLWDNAPRCERLRRHPGRGLSPCRHTQNDKDRHRGDGLQNQLGLARASVGSIPTRSRHFNLRNWSPVASL